MESVSACRQNLHFVASDKVRETNRATFVLEWVLAVGTRGHRNLACFILDENTIAQEWLLSTRLTRTILNLTILLSKNPFSCSNSLTWLALLWNMGPFFFVKILFVVVLLVLVVRDDAWHSFERPGRLFSLKILSFRPGTNSALAKQENWVCEGVLHLSDVSAQ